jgi:hypothetical protein
MTIVLQEVTHQLVIEDRIIEVSVSGGQGPRGRDSAALAQTVTFTRAAGTLETGQTVFPIPFEFQEQGAGVFLNGFRLALGEDTETGAFHFTGGNLVLFDAITDDDDDLTAELFEQPTL